MISKVPLKQILNGDIVFENRNQVLATPFDTAVLTFWKRYTKLTLSNRGGG